VAIDWDGRVIEQARYLPVPRHGFANHGDNLRLDIYRSGNMKMSKTAMARTFEQVSYELSRC
jgi:hypothetical protein